MFIYTKAMNNYVIPLLTILMSGVFSAIVTYSLNARRENLDMMRNKGEVLFEYICMYENQLYSHYRPLLDVVQGKSIEQDVIIDPKPVDRKIVKHRIDMLLGMYFPKIKADFEVLIQAGNSLAKLEASMIKSNKSNKSFEVTEYEYSHALAELHLTSKRLQLKIVQEIDRTSKPLWRRTIF